MTPKEKAKELIKESTKLGNSYCAKRHCLWLCDEILEDTKEYVATRDLKVNIVYNEYWLNIKEEIIKYNPNVKY
jgi:hypothetical protein